MKNPIEESYTVKVVKDKESGAVLSQAWFNAQGEEHNADGPAVVNYDSAGKPVEWQWWAFGARHRHEENGPANISIDEENGTQREEYFFNGRLHRARGPAIVVKDLATGQPILQRFFRGGKPYGRDMENIAP